MESDRRIYFEFDSTFVASGVQLSPFKWPLRPGLLEHTDRAFGQLPGVFDDELPDGWGLLLMDRMFRQRGVDPATVSPLDRLAYLGDRTMGALTFHPPAYPPDRDPMALDLYLLGQNVEEVLSGETTKVLPEMMRAGGSPGGARPKVLVGVSGNEIVSGEQDLPAGFEPWLIKFSPSAEQVDAGVAEYAYWLMAREAGFEMPEARLFRAGKTGRFFGVRRFDRGPANQRFHVHTFGNLIHANFRIPSTDYAMLLKVTRALTRNHQDVLQVFRRMVFNVAAHNRDDHAKNFAFVMSREGQWSLSPAYDVTFSRGPGGEHSMSVAGEGGQPLREHVLRLADEFEIDRRVAKGIVDEVNAAVARWPVHGLAAGCGKSLIREIAAKVRAV